MLAEEQLNAMTARYEAATPGPWGVVGFSAADFEGVHTRYVKAGDLEVGSIRFYQNADASLVIHAPDDIPALIAEVRRLREENERLGDELFNLETDRPWRKEEVPDANA